MRQYVNIHCTRHTCITSAQKVSGCCEEMRKKKKPKAEEMIVPGCHVVVTFTSITVDKLNRISHRTNATL